MNCFVVATLACVSVSACSSNKSEPEVVPLALPKLGLVIDVPEGTQADDAEGKRSDYVLVRSSGNYMHVERDELKWSIDDLKEWLKKNGTLLGSEVLPDGWLAETKVMGDHRVEVHRTIGTPFKCSGQYDDGDDAERLRIRVVCLSLRPK